MKNNYLIGLFILVSFATLSMGAQWDDQSKSPFDFESEDSSSCFIPSKSYECDGTYYSDNGCSVSCPKASRCNYGSCNGIAFSSSSCECYEPH